MSQTLFLLYHPEPARPMSKAKSVGAHSICARRSLPCRKRVRADMESAPTFFVGAEKGAFCLIACVGATIGRPPTYRSNAFSGIVSCKANGRGRAMLAPTRVFRQPGGRIYAARQCTANGRLWETRGPGMPGPYRAAAKKRTPTQPSRRGSAAESLPLTPSPQTPLLPPSRRSPPFPPYRRC